MSTLKLGIATCLDLQNLYENSEYADRIGEYEILERFAQAFGLSSSEYESITDRCPTANMIFYLKDDKGKRFFNIEKDENGKEIFKPNQLVEYYYTQAICLTYGCPTDGTTCSTNTCGDSENDECSDENECYCVDEEICETNDECDTECTDCFGTLSSES